jgi:YVTN family beta-propeller protein|tara:strand:+ start:1431 stop:2807 length:1377 start_codon:yes stop_codon:yes gene_type:complete
MEKKMKNHSILLIAVSILAGMVSGCVTAGTAGTKIGAPTKGMSTAEYESLIFLDPQNTMKANFSAAKGMDGYFLIDNQGEPTISVVDYNKGETIKKIKLSDPPGTSFKQGGNHHIFVIPGGRYAWSSQRYSKDVMWTIDLTTHEVVDTFRLSMGGKTIVAPLHIGFAYKSPLAVTGNILDKKNGYLTFLRTDTRRPSHIVQLSCPGARDAMFTFDDSKVFTTCQQEPKGVSIVDVSGRKEIKFIPIKGGRAGGMTPDGKYFLVGASKAVVLIDTATNQIHKTIKVPGGGGNFTCLPDGSKCYAGLRKDNSVGVIDMASLELIKTIKTGKNGNRLYLNPANTRYGIFTNESGRSETVSVIDTQKDIKIIDIETGLGPHNVAFNPEGTRAIISTKKENVATLVDTSSANPSEWDVITTDIASGLENNGVRWVPSPSAILAGMAEGFDAKNSPTVQIAASE